MINCVTGIDFNMATYQIHLLSRGWKSDLWVTDVTRLKSKFTILEWNSSQCLSMSLLRICFVFTNYCARKSLTPCPHCCWRTAHELFADSSVDTLAIIMTRFAASSLAIVNNVRTLENLFTNSKCTWTHWGLKAPSEQAWNCSWAVPWEWESEISMEYPGRERNYISSREIFENPDILFYLIKLSDKIFEARVIIYTSRIPEYPI